MPVFKTKQIRAALAVMGNEKSATLLASMGFPTLESIPLRSYPELVDKIRAAGVDLKPAEVSPADAIDHAAGKLADPLLGGEVNPLLKGVADQPTMESKFGRIHENLAAKNRAATEADAD